MLSIWRAAPHRPKRVNRLIGEGSSGPGDARSRVSLGRSGIGVPMLITSTRRGGTEK
jgi:hypothetical protein